MDVVIHIGRQKTGSTDIQARLSSIRDQLAPRGVLYSQAFGKKKAVDIKKVFIPGKPLKGGDAAAMIGAFEAELAGKPEMLIVSNENLFDTESEVIAAIRDMVIGGGGTPRIHAYVRRPDEHASSLFQQSVRTGLETWSMDEFLDAMIAERYYESCAYLDRWADAFGRDAVKVRLFHREVVEGTPFDDFAAWIGLPVEGIEFPQQKPGKSKASFDAASVNAIRLFRTYDDEHPGAFTEQFMMKVVRKGIRHLDARGPRLSLTAAQAEKIAAATGADLARLAAEYLSPREAELLLVPARGTSPVVRSGSYEAIARVLDVIGRLGEVLGTPASDASVDAPLDPVAEELLGILRAYSSENPDGVDDAAVAEAERLLRRRHADGTVGSAARPAPVGEYALFCRFVEICGRLGSLSKPVTKRRTGAAHAGPAAAVPPASAAAAAEAPIALLATAAEDRRRLQAPGTDRNSARAGRREERALRWEERKTRRKERAKERGRIAVEEAGGAPGSLAPGAE